MVALAATVVLIKWAPQWLAATDALKGKDRAEEIGRTRTALLAALAGVIAVIGAVYTARTFALNQQGQITERFTRAIDQLGSTSLQVRLGGIYALERLARESSDDHGPIVEILTAYVREHTPAPTEEQESELADHYPEDFPWPPKRDVQAALTVLGRRQIAHDPPPPWRLDLAGAYLPRADLRGARLRRASLVGATLGTADLRGADLWEADLRNARLWQANLDYAQLGDANCRTANFFCASMERARMPRASLVGAILRDAQLRDARLQGADLADASLAGADLSGADLEGATLFGASLGPDPAVRDRPGARLQGANLHGADLTTAQLHGATYNADTTWPDSFDPLAAGVVMATDETDAP